MPKFSMKIVVALIGLVVVMVACVFWLKTQKANQPLPDIAPVTQIDTNESLSPSQSPMIARAGIILKDDVGAMENPFDVNSSKVAVYRTGDRVVVYDRKWQSDPSGPSEYQVNPDKSGNKEGLSDSGEKKGWIDEQSVLVADEVGLMQVFVIATRPMFESGAEVPTLEDKKLAVLDSEDFLEKCSHNPDVDYAAPCLRRLFYKTTADQLVSRWFKILNDEKIADFKALNAEMGNVLSSGAADAHVDQFIPAFAAFSEAKKASFINQNCDILSSSEAFFATLLEKTAQESPPVFEAFANCVNVNIVSNLQNHPMALNILDTKLNILSKERRAAIKYGN